MEFNSNLKDYSTKLQIQVLQSLSGLSSTSVDDFIPCDRSTSLLCANLISSGNQTININVDEIQVLSFVCLK